MTMSVGVAVLLEHCDIEAALGRMALRELWGIAGRIEQRLAALGITTPLQLRDADPQFIRERFNVVMQRMVMELRGVPCIALEEVAPDRKSVMASRSFGRPVTSFQELREAVSTYAARAAEKIRRQNLAAGQVSVFVHTNPFKESDPQYYATRSVRLPVASADTSKILHAARTALADIWKSGFHYKKAGVMLLDLAPAHAVQGDLWESPDTPARKCGRSTPSTPNTGAARLSMHQRQATGMGPAISVQVAAVLQRHGTNCCACRTAY
jgi:DNA polymerase V